jgi:hypothetical protein
MGGDYMSAFIDTIKEKAGDILVKIRSEFFKLSASDNKVSDLEHSRRMNEHLQNMLGITNELAESRAKTIEECHKTYEECQKTIGLQRDLVESMEELIERHNDTIAGYRLQHSIICENMREIVRMLLISTDTSFERIYELAAPALDHNGWSRLRVAQRMIPEDVYSFFSGDNNKGKFEGMGGYDLLYWLELIKYGDISYCHTN